MLRKQYAAIFDDEDEISPFYEPYSEIKKHSTLTENQYKYIARFAHQYDFVYNAGKFTLMISRAAWFSQKKFKLAFADLAAKFPNHTEVIGGTHMLDYVIHVFDLRM